MSTVTTIPTVEQSSAFASLVRWGELTVEHRALIVELLDQVASSTRLAGQVAEWYPDESEL